MLSAVMAARVAAIQVFGGDEDVDPWDKPGMTAFVHATGEKRPTN
jgi:hypothetical protein